MRSACVAGAGLIAGRGAVRRKKPPVARPTPPPPADPRRRRRRGRRAARAVAEPTIVPPEPVRDDAIASASLDDLNRNSPLKPVFFEYDSSELTGEAQAVLDANAALLKQIPDLDRDDRRSLRRARHRRVQSGIGRTARRRRARPIWCRSASPADRLRTVSYGKEFPFDPGHDERRGRRTAARTS